MDVTVSATPICYHLARVGGSFSSSATDGRSFLCKTEGFRLSDEVLLWDNEMGFLTVAPHLEEPVEPVVFQNMAHKVLHGVGHIDGVRSTHVIELHEVFSYGVHHQPLSPRPVVVRDFLARISLMKPQTLPVWKQLSFDRQNENSMTWKMGSPYANETAVT
ncbi:hypothetical protein P175DRAFT_0553040 [Aspergillus ochraceoroseus IBT 24754]|uniref:Uncharacterized protein n=1 Tax=Aspergillus ochraceoroseus IBT 24754 TaxID=1392256 RepID=A0A2T5M5A8_9EURO|nr:uncharacterized protein P175DRAFT_0553040 [Aspergillus ochraceoroseus IBT 24754]PTU23727.1 hypothetical protein P175DRAFT_0553040 [Aspergillus ochraceoroseus IBT 24754]